MPVDPNRPPNNPPAPEAPPTPPTPPAGGDPLDNMSPDELKAIIKSTRSEAAERRVNEKTLREENDRLKQAETDRKAKELEEQGQWRERAQQLEQENKQRLDAAKNKIREKALRDAATAAGIIDPDLVSHVDTSGIVVTDDLEVSGITEAIATHKAKKPMLYKEQEPPPPPPVRNTGSDAPAPGSSAAPPAGDTFENVTSVKDLSPEQYAKFKRKTLSEARKDLGKGTRVSSV